MWGLSDGWGCNPSSEAKSLQWRFPFLQNHSVSCTNFPETNTSGPGRDISQASLTEADLSCSSKPLNFSLASSSLQRKSKRNSGSWDREEGHSQGCFQNSHFSDMRIHRKSYSNSSVFFYTGSLRFQHLLCLWNQQIKQLTLNRNNHSPNPTSTSDIQARIQVVLRRETLTSSWTKTLGFKEVREHLEEQKVNSLSPCFSVGDRQALKWQQSSWDWSLPNKPLGQPRCELQNLVLRPDAEVFSHPSCGQSEA